MEILVKRNVRRRIKVDATIIMIGDGLMELAGMIPTSKLREMECVVLPTFIRVEKYAN